MRLCHHYHHYSCMPPKCESSICTQYALNPARISPRTVTPKKYGTLLCWECNLNLVIWIVHILVRGRTKDAATSWLPSTCNFSFWKRAPTSKASIENKRTYGNDIFFEVQKPAEVTRNHWRISAFCLTMLKCFWLSETNTRNLDSVFVV